MKTPRQILLDQHAAADPKLARLQSEVLSHLLARSPAFRPSPFSVLRLAQKLWAELFLPARHLWTGFAVVWAVILTINVSTADHSTQVADANPLTATMLMAWKEQRQLVDELTGTPTAKPADRRKQPILQPRSERHTTFIIG